MTRLLAVAVLTCGLATAAADEKAEKAELEKFSGKWKGVTVTQDGKEMPKADAEAVRLTVAGEKYTLKMGDQDIEGTHKLDPTKKPKQIGAVQTKVPQTGEKMLPINELEGDSFNVCFAAPSKGRPTGSKSTAGSGQRVLTFKRDKP